MTKSIIINGPRFSGKTTMVNSFTRFFKEEELLRLTPGSERIFKESVRPTESIRIVIIDSVSKVTEIVYQEEYLRHVFHLFPSFMGVIYVTQDSQGILENYSQFLSDFTIFSLSEYKTILKVTT